MTTANEQRDIIYNWWRANLYNANDGAARALSARLRRATGMLDVLSERAVHELGDDLRMVHDPARLSLVVMVLAQLDNHKTQTFAACCGEVVGQSGEGKQKTNKHKLSELRFQNIIRSDDPMELATQLRRALPIIGNACNVGRLGVDLLKWNHPDIGERMRARWWFDYFGGAMPAATETEKTETQEASL
jgi:CRISPR system Cascade subunit CasB